MRKDSSNSRGDKRQGPGKKFSGKTGSKPFSKEGKPFKKKYEGSNAGAGDAGGGDRPYSGQPKDSEGSFKPSWKRESGKSARQERTERGERIGRQDDNNRTEQSPWKRERPAKRTEDRKPFREFDRDKRISSKPFDKERSEKPSWKRELPATGGKGMNGSESRPPREFNNTERNGGKTFDKNKRPYGENGERKARPFSNDRVAGESGKPKSAGDSRPFRDRPKPFADRKPAADEAVKQEKETPAFDKVLKNAFNPPVKKKGTEPGDPVTPVIHEDKIFGELADPIVEEKPKKFSIAKKNGADKSKVTGAFTKKKFIHDHSEGRKKKYKDDEEDDEDDKAAGKPEQMPLNKYIAHSGECSRRDAAELVKQGKVKVNGELILDPGYKVKEDDLVTLVGKKLKPTKNNAYILLNKPKGYITTNEDPQGRKTVMELLSNSGFERLFPVGRLDRDTSGLLLITNDGDLTQKLSHPSFNVKKVYHVTLDKPLTKAHFEKILEGVELEDGKAIVDEIAYLEVKNEIGLEIHSGKNRIVRRIFESLGYVVEKLDRMMYAGLTKKNLPRGKWRHLDPKEVLLLKHFKS